MLERGQLLGGDFEIVAPLSQGGMGAVYLAHQRSTDAKRVVKVMLPGLVHREELRARFEREARVSGRIGSEHVVKTVAYGVDGARGLPWLAMEYLPGATLEQRALERGRPTPDGCYELLRQIFHGVASAHAAGVVHRDLKPGNIYVADAQRADVPFTVKVLDFGIAKLVESSPQGTQALGTRAWMAPEQERVDSPILPAADVWALGLITFWLLSGRSFWRHADVADSRLSYELHFAVIPLASARSQELGSGPVSAAFDAWFQRAVARDPAQRFRDAGAAWEALEPLLRASAAAQPVGRSRAALTTRGDLTDDTPPSSRGTVARRAERGLSTLVALALGGALVALGSWCGRGQASMNPVVAGPRESAPLSSAAPPTPTAGEPLVAPGAAGNGAGGWPAPREAVANRTQ